MGFNNISVIYINMAAVSFSGGANQSTRRKPPTFLRAAPFKYTWEGKRHLFQTPPPPPMEKKPTQHKKNMVSHPQPTEK